MTVQAMFAVVAASLLGFSDAQNLGILTNPLGTLTNTGSRLNPVNLGTRAFDQTIGKFTNTSVSDISRQLTDNFFAGTKWCGAGDVAKNYDDLGPSRATDACCREHDHSEDNIAALQSKYGLRNTNLYTMTHCKDDRKFYGCLLNDSSLPSATVGKLFFNILRTKCFDYTYPKKCVQNNALYIPLITEKCREYRLDPSGPKEWQTFSPPNFYKDYLARKKGQQTNQTRPSVPVPPLGGASVPVPTEEPEEEPEEEPIEDAEPDNWQSLDPADISLDATEEPVYEDTTPRPLVPRLRSFRG
ncbi:hypothetical protein HPB48_019874 [Haemaphysalis longicornis]|uniref:Phospholipase A2 n=1 Tax=Haemaphysalis longicornis TaxID=44386 RepID=A0A9J6FY86_HAELO|nr:hypothetical protein HPB48_019874 [Haemaphysalis longicornis]